MKTVITATALALGLASFSANSCPYNYEDYFTVMDLVAETEHKYMENIKRHENYGGTYYIDTTWIHDDDRDVEMGGDS